MMHVDWCVCGGGGHQLPIRKQLYITDFNANKLLDADV